MGGIHIRGYVYIHDIRLRAHICLDLDLPTTFMALSLSISVLEIYRDSTQRYDEDYALQNQNSLLCR